MGFALGNFAQPIKSNRRSEAMHIDKIVKWQMKKNKTHGAETAQRNPMLEYVSVGEWYRDAVNTPAFVV